MNKLKYGWLDFINHFLNQRLLVFIIFQLTILHIYINSVRRFVRIADYPASPWILPFVCADVYFLLIYGISVVYVYSNTPFTQRSQMYVLMRQGKMEWVLTKIVRIWLTAFFLIMIEVCLSIFLLLPRIEWTKEWGKIYYSLALTNAADDYGVLLNFSYEMINLGSPIKIMGISLLVMFVVTGLIGTVMFAISLAINRLTAAFVGTVLAIFTVVLQNVYYMAGWFSYLCPFSWINILTLYGEKYSRAPSLAIVLAAGLGLTLVLIFISCMVMRKKNLTWIEEE